MTDQPDAPRLQPDQLARLAQYGVPQEVRYRDVVFRPGDANYDLIVIDAGRIEIVSPAIDDEPEAVVATYGPGGFLGELNLMTGQTAFLIGRVIEAGRIHRISGDRFRQLMADDPEISDVILRAFLARQDAAGVSAGEIEIIGSSFSTEALALRTYAARQRLAHLWLDADSAAGQALMRSTTLTATDLPAVITAERVVRRADPEQLAANLGWSYRPVGGDLMDLVIVGCGPAGLAAAVAAASQGLRTLVLDRTGVGGHAASSFRIDDHPGFPSGITGLELTRRAARQASDLGTQLAGPRAVTALDATGGHLRVMLTGGASIDTRVVLIATGARYHRLSLPEWSRFEGAGIYYAATDMETRSCVGEPVTVLGGANSAGQAALQLALRGNSVTLVARGPNLRMRMSASLVDRLIAHPSVTIRTSTEITGLIGDERLEAIVFRDSVDPDELLQPCRGLFCFIGADAATSWNHGVSLDRRGFIRTGQDFDPDALGPTWSILGRAPLLFETSVAAVFAAGDVRAGSVKRVASAVGDGSSAVRSVQQAIGIRF